MSSAPDLTSRVLRHQRAVIGGGLALLVALSWWFLAEGAGMDDHMGMHPMPPPIGAFVLMWWLMMVAMMLPSAAPAILLYARVRQARGGDAAVAQTWVFLAGYLGVWLLFSVAAAASQLLLIGAAMDLGHRGLEGTLLIAAGLYQLSPVKLACLRQCRSPVEFLTRHWRPGTGGAVRLGVLHGAYCVGCCWLLMALLFVGGVMNLMWVVALTLIVAAEKLLPRGELLGRVAGVALVAWGILRIAGY